MVTVTQTSATKTRIHRYFLFQTNRDLRSKDQTPNQVSKEAKKIRMGENTSRIPLGQADEASHPRAPRETMEIQDRIRENLGE